MQILKWLLVNWDSVLLIAMVVALIIYLIKTGQTKILKQIAIKFVTDAEGECGAGTGIIKLSGCFKGSWRPAAPYRRP